MTDFETIDGAVSTMKEVIYSVDQNIIIKDLTHKIESFNTQEAGYSLYQAMELLP